MSIGQTFLRLRQISKRRLIDDIGSVNVDKKWNDRNYRKHRETEIRIDVNIIHIILIVFSDIPDP